MLQAHVARCFLEACCSELARTLRHCGSTIDSIEIEQHDTENAYLNVAPLARVTSSGIRATTDCTPPLGLQTTCLRLPKAYREYTKTMYQGVDFRRSHLNAT